LPQTALAVLAVHYTNCSKQSSNSHKYPIVFVDSSTWHSVTAFGEQISLQMSFCASVHVFTASHGNAQ
jgi:hypothetical protein